MSVTHLQIGISDAALAAGAEPAPAVKSNFAPRENSLNRESARSSPPSTPNCPPGFPNGAALPSTLSSKPWPSRLINSRAVRHRAAQISRAAASAPRACAESKNSFTPSSKMNSASKKWRSPSALSTAHFARMFRKSTGQTPHQFVLRQRLERAKTMLRAADARVLDVACRVRLQNAAALRSGFSVNSGASLPPNIARISQTKRHSNRSSSKTLKSLSANPRRISTTAADSRTSRLAHSCLLTLVSNAAQEKSRWKLSDS